MARAGQVTRSRLPARDRTESLSHARSIDLRPGGPVTARARGSARIAITIRIGPRPGVLAPAAATTERLASCCSGRHRGPHPGNRHRRSDLRRQRAMRPQTAAAPRPSPEPRRAGTRRRPRSPGPASDPAPLLASDDLAEDLYHRRDHPAERRPRRRAARPREPGSRRMLRRRGADAMARNGLRAPRRLPPRRLLLRRARPRPLAATSPGPGGKRSFRTQIPTSHQRGGQIPARRRAQPTRKRRPVYLSQADRRIHIRSVYYGNSASLPPERLPHAH